MEILSNFNLTKDTKKEILNNIFKNLNIKKPFNKDNYTIFNIYKNNSPILIETPYVFIKNLHKYINQDLIKSINLINIKNNNNFIYFIKKLEEFIKLKINNYNKNLLINKNFNNSIDNNNLIIKNNYKNNINIYNLKKEKISIDTIKSDTKVKCIIQLKSFWINELNYGFNYKLLQILNCDFLNFDCMFSINLNQSLSNNISSPPPPPPMNKKNHTLKLKKRKDINFDKKIIEENPFEKVCNEIKNNNIKLKSAKNRILKEKKNTKEINKINYIDELENILRKRIGSIRKFVN